MRTPAQNASLRGKLKWIIFDACNGDTQVGGKAVALEGKEMLELHVDCDVVRVHPASKSYLAFGNRFFRSFLETIDGLTGNITIEQYVKKLVRYVDRECESVSAIVIITMDEQVNIILMHTLFSALTVDFQDTADLHVSTLLRVHAASARRLRRWPEAASIDSRSYPARTRRVSSDSSLWHFESLTL